MLTFPHKEHLAKALVDCENVYILIKDLLELHVAKVKRKGTEEDIQKAVKLQNDVIDFWVIRPEFKRTKEFILEFIALKGSYWLSPVETEETQKIFKELVEEGLICTIKNKNLDIDIGEEENWLFVDAKKEYYISIENGITELRVKNGIP